MEITKEMALHFAKTPEYDLTWEVESCIELGYSPAEALREWDCMPTKEELLDYMYNNINNIIS